MNAPFKNSIAALVPELTEWRRDFHRHPELLYACHRTAKVVAQRLREFGFDEVHEGVGKTGVVGLLHGASGAAMSADKRVLLRADMDALPIHEATGAEHGSQSPGVMHACGHDGHTTLLLGAAKHLAQARDFDGTLVFCFQPAEEGGAGAEAMIEDGLFERFPVKGVYGLHNWPGLPVGQFAVARGPAMASADRLEIVVQGKGGHGAMPHLARDPIVAAAEIVMSLQTIVSRVIDPLEPAVLSITAIHAGEAFNVIPDTVEMRGTIRTMSDATAERMQTEIRRICAGVAAAHDMTVEIKPSPTKPYPTTVNHPKETDIAVAAMRAVVGPENVHDGIKPVMGAEDFAFMLRRVPGAYIFMGNGDSAPVHHPAYDFNDEALPYGVAYWGELARRALAAP
ncbi:MAG: amidohydrolase [Pseudomonadota bacterium]|nr:amidohydrolase [Pseudomonadota bacterium]